MPNTLDYIDWRGDLPFSDYPVNAVDEMIFAFIGKPDFTGIIPKDAGAVTLAEAVDAFFEKNPNGASLGLLASQKTVPMLKKLKEAPRYGGLKLSLFARDVSVGNTKQFSALTVRVPDGPTYVTFRGTDDSLTGWKENFRIAVSGAVPAQEDAVCYLHRAATCFDGPLVVSGHSKGGNLAIYAAAHMPKAIRDRIEKVISYDGPGFLDDFLASEGYLDLRERVLTIVPENSIVGMLLGQAGRIAVVRSETTGVTGHDGLTWSVGRSGFLPADDLSEGSLAFGEAVRETLAEMDAGDVEELVDGLFGVLDASGAVNVSDFSENTVRKLIDTARGLGKEPEVTRFLLKLVGDTLKNRGEDIVERVVGTWFKRDKAEAEEPAALPEKAEPGADR